MASAVTKRQQARNERALQDITRTVAGNDRCADCNTPNPSWASWNLGVFLCMRCAALHRKLGTHISKVKSLSMDSWSVEQVENMRKTGNAASNRMLNPRNIAAKIPVDVDEVDAAIERHIRLKYEQRAFSGETRSAPSTRHNTGSTGVGSDEPPPLPPKPSRSWGFNTRSASSTLPKTKKHDYPEAPISSAITVEESRGKRGFFGMRVTSIGNNFDQKLNMLKEMGFTDAKQNQDILKNANGNLDRAVEVLTRLHESILPERETRRDITPVSRASSGLKLSKTRSSQPESAWEVKESKRSATAPLPPLPTRSQSTEPVNNAWNPFLQQSQSIQDLTSTMQNMNILQPAPQAYTQAALSVQTTANPWGLYMQPQQAMSVPAISQQYQASPIASTNPFYQTASPQSFTSSNPWSQQLTPQTMTPATPHSNPFGLPGVEIKPSGLSQQATMQHDAQYGSGPSTTYDQASTPNPFMQLVSPSATQHSNSFALLPSAAPTPAYVQNQQPQQTDAQSPYTQPGASQSPFSQNEASQQPFAQAGAAASPFSPNATSPFAQSAAPPFTQSAFPQPGVQHAASFPQAAPAQPAGYQHFVNNGTGLGSQPTGRLDKSSIMALYSQAQPAPLRQLQTLPENSVSAPISPLPPQSSNPFAAQQVSITAHSSRESRDFQAFQQDDRHSPDAFAGLSSRFMR